MLLYLSHYPLPANTGLCTVLYDIAIRRAKCVKKLFKESSCLRTPARAQLILSLYGGAHLAEWPLSPTLLDRLLVPSWTDCLISAGLQGCCSIPVEEDRFGLLVNHVQQTSCMFAVTHFPISWQFNSAFLTHKADGG